MVRDEVSVTRYEIGRLQVISSSDLHDINALIPQLSRSAPPLRAEQLQAIIDHDANVVLVARDRERADHIVGTLTLAMFPIPTGLRAFIEDVVVDDGARGGGVGELLTRAAVSLAESKGAKTVDLTSRPDREAANRLYIRCGFEIRDTNVYRFAIAG